MAWMPTTVQDRLETIRPRIQELFEGKRRKELTKGQLRALKKIRNFLEGQEQSPNPVLPCGCDRLVPADCLVIIPQTLRSRVGGRRFACGHCVERAFRRGVWTREEFATEAGAPPAVIQKARNRDET